MVADISNNSTRNQKISAMLDLSGDQQNIKTFVYKLPFLPGDKINFYIRNFINLDFDKFFPINLFENLFIKNP